MLPNVILGPPIITESTRAEKVEIKNTTRYCEVLALRLGPSSLTLILPAVISVLSEVGS